MPAKNVVNLNRRTPPAPRAIVAAGSKAPFTVGTRHNGIAPSLATLTRMPLALPVKAPAKAPGQGTKSQYIIALLTAAGSKGLTWAAIQAALIAKFGNAPKKRRTLYLLLQGTQHYRTTGAAGVKTYFLGKAPIVPTATN